MAARSRARAAATKSHRITPAPVGATDPDKDAALIEDGTTGKVLYARNETALRHPASLTKMMTLYLLFEALRDHRITMQSEMEVSRHAAEQKPTKLSLRPRQKINVETAIRAIVIRSANDVAVVIAEALGGTESHFAEMMTAKARQLGMKDTNYHNASGLPDPLQITTAMDLAVLARHVAYDFPQYFFYFGTAGFNYKGAYYPTHDNLIGRYQGADGIKTGYTGASGFNLATSVTRNGVHLIAIVMGGRTAIRRDLEMMHLLDTEFAQIDANPTLVARATPPWQNLAAYTPPPILPPDTGLPNTPVSAEQFAALARTPMPPATPSQAATDDEDAAESRRAPDENYSIIHAEAPALASVAQTPTRPAALPAVPAAPLNSVQPQTAPTQQLPAMRSAMMSDRVASAGPTNRLPPIRPTPRPSITEATLPTPRPKNAAVAKPELRRASAQPTLRPDAGEGDVDQTSGRSWTIQIGAFADAALAKAQLEAFAEKANDVVGQAARIVAPITNARGHTLYRARFGLYAQREAVDVCNKLSQRGQSCFAVINR